MNVGIVFLIVMTLLCVLLGVYGLRNGRRVRAQYRSSARSKSEGRRFRFYLTMIYGSAIAELLVGAYIAYYLINLLRARG